MLRILRPYNLLCIVLTAMALGLSTCGSAPEIVSTLPGATVAVTATITPTPMPTITPTLLPTPTIVPTPDLALVLPEAGPLCEAAFAASATGKMADSPMMALVKSSPDEGWEYDRYGLPILSLPHLTARSAQEVKTLICIRYVDSAYGTYSDGSRALRTSAQVRLARWPGGEVLVANSFLGPLPPYSKTGGGDVSGGPPGFGPIYDWIASHTNDLVTYNTGRQGTEFTITPFGFSEDGSKLYAVKQEANNYETATLLTWDTTKSGTISQIDVPFTYTYWVVPMKPSIAYQDKGGTLILIDPASGRNIAQLTQEGWNGGSVSSMTASPDGSRLALGLADSSIVVLDSGSGQVLCDMKGHTDYVSGVDWSPDGKLLASGSVEDKTFRIWDTEACKLLHTVTEKNGARRALWAPTGSMLMVHTRYEEFSIWDVSSGYPRLVSRGYGGVTWLPDDEHVIGVNNYSSSRETTIFDTTSHDPVGKLSLDQEELVDWNSAAVFGSRIAVATSAGVTIWELDGSGYHQASRFGTDRNVGVVEWSPDGSRIAALGGSSSDWAAVYDTATGQELYAISVIDPASEGVSYYQRIGDVSFVGDGSAVALQILDGQVKLWKPAEGDNLGPLQRGVIGQHADVAFSPDGALAAISTEDGLAFVWDVEAGTLARTLDVGNGVPNHVEFSADGASLITDSIGDAPVLNILDAKTGEVLYSYTNRTLKVPICPESGKAYMLWLTKTEMNQDEPKTSHTDTIRKSDNRT